MSLLGLKVALLASILMARGVWGEWMGGWRALPKPLVLPLVRRHLGNSAEMKVALAG